MTINKTRRTHQATATPGLGPFLDQLAQRLDHLDATQLRRTLLHHAERLHPDQRPGFLRMFAPPADPPAASAETGARPGRADRHDPDLLAEVECFVADILNKTYTQPEHLDVDAILGAYPAFADPPWASRLDALFDRAAEAFLTGNAALARDAYQPLLELFGRADAQHGFTGEGSPEELIGTDLNEAKHRCLRAV